MTEIRSNEVYSTKEVRGFLKISNSTIKRWLKNGIIQANKIGGRYRILGAEILRLISPTVEQKTTGLYRKIKDKTKKIVEKW